MNKYVIAAKDGSGDITDDNGNVIEFKTLDEAESWAMSNDVSSDDFDIDEISVKSTEQIKSEGSKEKESMDESIRRSGGNVQPSDIFPRTFDEDVNTGKAIERAWEDPSLASIANVPRAAILQGIGTGLDLASVPGRMLRSTGHAIMDDSDSKMETFLTKLPEINPEGIIEGTLVDPLTYLTMGSPSGRVIDAAGTVIGRAGKLLPRLTTMASPTWKSALGTGALETAVQSGIGSYDEPTNPFAYAPSLLANTLLGRYGVRGSDLMSEGEKMLYKNLTPTPTQAKTSKVLGDVAGTKPLLERGIARVGKEDVGSGMLKRLKENVSDIGTRQDEIRYGEPSESNIFSSTSGNAVISDNLGIASDMPDDVALDIIMKDPKLSKNYNRMLEVTQDPKTALNIVRTALPFEPYAAEIKAAGFEEVPFRIVDALKESTNAVGESNIKKFGVEERKIREKMLSKGGQLYEDLKDLAQAGVRDKVGYVKNLNSIIDYKRKLDNLATEYGSFDKPSMDQTAKARLYRETSEELQKHIDNLTTDDAVELFAQNAASDMTFGDLPMTPERRSMTGAEFAEESYKYLDEADKIATKLKAPEQKRVKDFRATQQEFAELLPWRDVIEDKLGKLNAGNESGLNLSKSGIFDAATRGAKSAFTGYPSSTYMPKGSVKESQRLYDIGKEGVKFGDLPKKGVAIKALENTAREGIDYVFPDFAIESDKSPIVFDDNDEETVDMLVKGGTSKVRLKAPKKWKSVEDIK